MKSRRISLCATPSITGGFTRALRMSLFQTPKSDHFIFYNPHNPITLSLLMHYTRASICIRHSAQCKMSEGPWALWNSLVKLWYQKVCLHFVLLALQSGAERSWARRNFLSFDVSDGVLPLILPSFWSPLFNCWHWNKGWFRSVQNEEDFYNKHSFFSFTKIPAQLKFSSILLCVSDSRLWVRVQLVSYSRGETAPVF